MSWLVTIAVDLALGFAFLCSLSMAGAWGELCGIRPGGDKSGLGGFAMALILAVIRWLALAVALAVAARPGELVWLLGGHAALGAFASFVFSRQVDVVHRDGVVPAWRGVAVGVLLPLPAFALPLVRLHHETANDAPLALAATAGGLAVLHGLIFHQRRRGMRPRT